MSRTAARRPLPRVVGLGLLGLGVLLLALSGPSIVPAIDTARAVGTPGFFSPQRRTCASHPGHESCYWTGQFRSADGRIRRSGVYLTGTDQNALSAGSEVPATDLARPRRVYGPEGSREWVPLLVLLLTGTSLVVFVAYRSRPARSDPAPRSEH